MAHITPQRLTVEIDGDFVVFLIGMRINKPWKVHKWLPVFLAMPRMLKELQQRPESGFLGCTMGFPAIVQYWRSFEHLEAYARSKDLAHWPAWVAFNKRVGGSRGDVGIWHETSVRSGVRGHAPVRPGQDRAAPAGIGCPRVSARSDRGEDAGELTFAAT
ncbi:MAG: DUF4188 domain-containing protein [Chloroflexi bacterium]|nr:MAG: DUF4188 domain-containing protein [Chloroflexota bacterium]